MLDSISFFLFSPFLFPYLELMCVFVLLEVTHLAFPQLTHLLSRLFSTILMSPRWKPRMAQENLSTAVS